MRFVFNWLLLFVVFSGILCFPMFMLINIGVLKPNCQLPLYAITEIIEKEDKVYIGLGSIIVFKCMTSMETILIK